jgi:hypothetical protein
MYISRLVKTRSPHSGLEIAIPSPPFPFKLFHWPESSPLFFYSLLHLYLLLVYLGGSATTPSHIQKGPSVAIPSVRVSQLSR